MIKTTEKANKEMIKIDQATINFISIMISFSAAFISLSALIYTIKTFWLKQGLKLRGGVSIASSIRCADQYISEIVIENEKDRAVAIYRIYLKLGHNYFILVEDFEQSPLILGAFESYTKQYDPIDLYSINMDRIDLNKLFENRRIKRKIVLATSEGKYVINRQLKYWNPIGNFFKNYLTANIVIRRINFEGNSYGENTKYIVIFKTSGDHEEVVPIYAHDYQIRKFKDFKLTKESLESRDSLEEYIFEQLVSLNSNFSDIIVYDYEKWQQEFYKDEYRKVIVAKKFSWFTYHILGPIYTKISNIKLRNENKAIKKKNETRKQIKK